MPQTGRKTGRNINFTKGNLISSLFLFSIPLVAGDLFQSLYNSVDAMIAGNLISDHALAAISVCGTLSKLLVGFFNGMSIGSSVVVGYAFGEGDRRKMVSTISACVSFSCALGIILSLLCELFSPQLIRLAGVPQEVYHDALLYLRIYLIGLAFTVIYNIGAGILRAIGDSNASMIIIIISCVSNLVLDTLFVYFMKLGVAGIAIATILCQSISVALVYLRIKRWIPELKLHPDSIPRNFGIIRRMLSIGVPSGLQVSLITFSNLFIWRYINSFGVTAAAGIGVGQRLDQFAALPPKAFGLSLTASMSQNIGAGNEERCRDSIKYSLLISLPVCLLICAVFYVFAEQLSAIFTQDPEVLSISVAMVRVIVLFYIMISVREIMVGALRGFGKTRVPMFCSIFGLILCRQLWLFFTLRSDHAIQYIYWSYPLGWTCATLLITVYFFIHIKKKFREAFPHGGEVLSRTDQADRAQL